MPLVSLILIFALVVSGPTLAVGDDPLPAGYSGLVRMLVEARGRNVSRAEKAEVLRVASEQYKHLLQQRTGLDEAGLLKKFQNDDAFRSGLLSATDPYRTLYSEINFLASSLISDGVFDRCNQQFDPKWLQEQSITRNILEQRSRYEAACEGAGYRGDISILSRRAGKRGSGETSYASFPLIFSGNNAATLLELSEQIELASSLKERPSLLGRDFPAYQEKGSDPQKNRIAQENYVELKRTEQLKAEIYRHALVNSYRTKALIDFFFAGKSLAEVKAGLLSEARIQCASCTPRDQSEIVDRALNAVLSEQKSDPTGHTKFKDPRSLVVRMCNRLIDAGYFNFYWKDVERKFENGKFVVGKEKRDRLREPGPDEKFIRTPKVLRPDLMPGADHLRVASKPTIGLRLPGGPPKEKPRLNLVQIPRRPTDSRLPSGAAMDAEYDYYRFQKQRMSIYQSVVKEGFTNVLFMTDALSDRNDTDQGTEYTPKLLCTQDSLSSDAELVEAAMDEAKKKTDEVVGDLNRTIKPANLNNPKAAEENRKQIEKMIAKNPTAVGQSVAEKPMLASLVCDGLNRNILSDLRDQEMHDAFLWGVNIVGTGLMFTGVGSGVGLELLIAGGMLASSASLTVDKHLQSEDARELAELMRTQFRGGQSGNEYLLEVSEDKVREYRELKVGLIDVFGVGVDATGMIGAGLKTSMTMAGMNRLVHAARDSKTFRETIREREPLEVLREFSKSEAALAAETKRVNFTRAPSTPHVLESAEDHVRVSNYAAASTVNVGFNPKLTTSEVIPTFKRVMFEPIPEGASAPLPRVTVYRRDGAEWKSLGDLKHSRKTLDLPLLEDGSANLYRYDLSYADGTKVTMTGKDILRRSPPGMRPNITLENKWFKQAGFLGGHTKQSWDQTMKTYGDRVRIDPGATTTVSIAIPGSNRRHVVQMMRYSIDGKKIDVPKSILFGTDEEIRQFEEAVAPLLKRAAKEAPSSQKEIRIPMEGGELVAVREPNGKGAKSFGPIKSWYIDTRPKLKLLPQRAPSLD